ncbi:MHS family MFS transporter [Naumannella sp. ID2617S]|nr:MHS family MFS transporter [Naumannella sp. ID2617S]
MTDTAELPPHLSRGHNPNRPGRVLTASLVGTTIEFFDFYAYGTAASLVFPSLFFPSKNPTTELLASFAVFGVAFLARPLGSLIFGHFGDRVGRKKTLVVSLLVMGIGTFLIGCLPTAHTPGWAILAPLFLVVLRFCQGIGLGGEWSGAALLATENAPPGKRAIYGTFPQLGAPIGFLTSNLLFLLLNQNLSAEAFSAWGWRIPFLVSALLVAVGLYVRFQLIETPSFQKVLDENQVVRLPLATVLKSSWKPLILGTIVMVATYVIFYMMTTFTLTYGTTADTVEKAAAAAAKAGKPFNAAGFTPGLGFARTEFLTYMIIAVVFFGIFTVVSGPLAERLGRKRMLMGVTVLIAAYGLVLHPIFNAGRYGALLGLIIGFILMGLTYGPMAAYLPELFPANVRYTGSAVSYNLASVVGAGPAPFALVALWQLNGGRIVYVGFYVVAAAITTMVGLALAHETRDSDYHTTSAEG